MSKILVSDLDGTFLDHDSSVPENAIKFLNFVRNMGFIVIFATCRPIGDAQKNVIKYACQDWLICNDGALGIEINNGKLSIRIENNITSQIASENASFFKSVGYDPLFFLGSNNDFEVLIPKSATKLIEREIRRSDESRSVKRYADVNHVINEQSIRAISLYGDISEEFAVEAQNFNYGKANVMHYQETRFEGKMWLDVISTDADKYKVSLDIANRFGVTCIDVALGNGINDLSLISNARWSACPISSASQVKENTTYKSNVKEGHMFLYDIIKQLEGDQWRV